MCRAESESSIDEDVEGMHVSRTMRVIELMLHVDIFGVASL